MTKLRMAFLCPFGAFYVYRCVAGFRVLDTISRPEIILFRFGVIQLEDSANPQIRMKKKQIS